MADQRQDNGRTALFALTLHYVVPLETVDELMEEHVRHLEHFYAAGTFLLSGRQVPRTGGFILALAPDRAAIEAVIAKDPFFRHQVAEYEVVELAPTMAEPTVRALLTERGAWAGAGKHQSADSESLASSSLVCRGR